jgi:glycerophosphoryl diester phosphodiesterase
MLINISKIKKILPAVLCICYTFSLHAQPVMALPGLDNYTIPVNSKGAIVGKIVFPDIGKSGRISLVKDTSGLFRISKSGTVSLKHNAVLLPSSGTIRYGVIVKIDKVAVDFELVKDEFIHNKVIAHRGAYKNHHLTENTIGSLKKAIELGYEGSEFDIWLSSDNVPVICHDGSVQGKQIEKTTAAELQKVDLKNGDVVPTLEQYLQVIKSQNKTCLFLEVKTSGISQERSLAVADSAVRLVHALKAQAWIKYISFNYGVLQRIRQLDPAANTAYLSGDKKVTELVADKVSGLDYPFYSFHPDKKLTQEAHQHGLSVNVWTVDKKEEMEFLLSCGVDMITTNEPEMLMDIITNKK